MAVQKKERENEERTRIRKKKQIGGHQQKYKQVSR